MKEPTLPPLPEPSPQQLRAAHSQLHAAFAEVRAHCAWIEAPFGAVFLARTSAGLCRVSFRHPEAELLDELEAHQLLPEMAPARLDRERLELAEYFAGRRRRFALPIDLRWVTDFQRRVLAAARQIPFGEVATYQQIAASAGRPRAARAVGNALGRNPLPIVIPCHRVVATSGLGGYTGGLDVKLSLMAIEGIARERST